MRAEDAAPVLGRRATVLVYAGLTAVVLAPVFAVTVPGLGDYLNHLARAAIMARVAGSADLQRFYQSGWRFVPYYGMDLPVLLLMRVLPVYVAGQVFVALCVLTPVMAVSVLRRAVQGRAGLVPVLAYVFGFNLVLAYGFLNYLFSAGLAVLLFAGWVATAGWRRWPRALLFSVGLVAVYLCHAFAAAAYCLMVAGYEIGRAARIRFSPVRVLLRDWAAAAGQAVPLVVLARLTAARVQLGAVSVTVYGNVGNRMAVLLSPFYFPDGGNWAALAILLALTGLFALRRVRFAPALWPPLVALCLASLLVPKTLMNVWGSDLRLPLLCVVLLLAALVRRPSFPVPVARLIVVAAVLLVVGKSYAAWRVLARFDAAVEQVRALVTALPRGSRLLAVEVAGADAPRRPVSALLTGHIPLVAVIDRDAFVPYLFTGVSAVQFQPAMALSSSSNGAPISMDDLRDGMARRDPPGGRRPFLLGGQVYWWDWPRKFDYVLIETFGADPGRVPDVLAPVAHNDVAALYRVMGPDPASTPAAP